MVSRVLVVDDERLIRWTLQEKLTSDGYDVVVAADGSEAVQAVKGGRFDCVLLDLRLPDIDGVTLLRKLKHIRPELAVIVVTACSSIDSAVDAMKSGAFDYISKPFDLGEIAASVRNVIANGAAGRQRISSAASEAKERFGLDSIVGETASMLQIKDIVRRVARSDSTTVLLLGESGTGKDMLSRALHYESARVDRPFVDITCTALPESLLESELFGYEKGAFTDAKIQKKGLFEIADGGTVYLDEIGDMRPALQAKLLRVLEDKAFKRLGGTADIHVDVRVIAATNRDIDESMRQGRFREDLYYRLSTVPIVIPPLRERREDIPLLARHFLHTYSYEFHQTMRELSSGAMAKLCEYDWPGNARELRNVIERAALLSQADVISADDLMIGRKVFQRTPLPQQSLVQLPKDGCVLSQVEKELIRQALDRTRWNQTQSAELLGITRDQIRYKISKYGLSRAQPGKMARQKGEITRRQEG